MQLLARIDWNALRFCWETLLNRNWWDEDVTAFKAELNALKNPIGDPADGRCGDYLGVPSEEKKRRGHAGHAITEANFFRYQSMFNYRPLQHARICVTWEKGFYEVGNGRTGQVRVVVVAAGPIS